MTTRILIDDNQLASNYSAIRTAVGPSAQVLAVIKANAYGHGAEHCAVVLARAGAPWLGVTSAEEGARVRTALTATGLPPHGQPAILVMCGFLPPDVPTLRQHRLTPVVWTPEHLRWLGSAPHPVHVEVDTGMGRQGVPPAELPTLLSHLQKIGHPLDGLFTHFCSAEVADSAITAHQQQRFDAALAQVRCVGLSPRWLHAANTSAVDNPGELPQWLATQAASVGAQMLVRSGLALYGYTLPIAGAAQHHLRPHVRPILTWLAPLLDVRSLAAGETVGYNATFTAPTAMRIGLLPVGYANGLRRELSGPHGWVMCNGRVAPILGRISMNLTVIDLSGHPDAQTGDEVVVLGPGITAEDHARMAGTIPYEILCGLHP